MTSSRDNYGFADDLEQNSVQHITRSPADFQLIGRNEGEIDCTQQTVRYTQPPSYRQSEHLEGNSRMPLSVSPFHDFKPINVHIKVIASAWKK